MAFARRRLCIMFFTAKFSTMTAWFSSASCGATLCCQSCRAFLTAHVLWQPTAAPSSFCATLSLPCQFPLLACRFPPPTPGDADCQTSTHRSSPPHPQYQGQRLRLHQSAAQEQAEVVPTTILGSGQVLHPTFKGVWSSGSEFCPAAAPWYQAWSIPTASQMIR